VPIDVVSETAIRRPRDEVSAYACDPDNATKWYRHIVAVDWETPRPLAVGTRLAFVARFLGRRMDYVYEVKEMTPGVRFVMATDDSSFPMETTYEWEDGADGGTTMRLRNRGGPARYTGLLARYMNRAVRRANRKDLARLKKLLEGRAS
jgi:Polyketide cyclase / dehydrase and lipid transport